MASQRYKPLQPLASGGMADVWLGVQLSATGFSRLCAIKTIKETSTQSEDYISMFRDEAKICQSLQHANVVQVYDFTELEDGYALVMEYVQGVNLTQVLQNLREAQLQMPAQLALMIAHEVARGLHYVHTRLDPLTEQNLGIVHRDISPSNILLSTEGEVKITDFGIAKARGSDHETQVGVVKGKFQYMSPEQFSGQDIDYRTDVFALGCVLWECLAGRKKYEAQSEVQLIQMVVQRHAYPDIRTINPRVDSALADLLSRAMAEDVTMRMKTAGEFATAIADYMAFKKLSIDSNILANFLQKFVPDDIEKSKDLVKKTFRQIEQVKHEESQAPVESQWSMPAPSAEWPFPSLDSSVGSFRNTQDQSAALAQPLQWGVTSERAMTNAHRRISRRSTNPIFSGFMTFSFAVLVVCAISAGVAQYALHIDVVGQAKKMSAKLREEIETRTRGNGLP